MNYYNPSTVGWKSYDQMQHNTYAQQHNYGTVPPPAQVGISQQHGSFLPAVDPVVANVAGNMLAHHGQSYLQQSQAYFQSKMGFLSGGTFLYLFAVTPQYVKRKLGVLILPFLQKWSFARQTEQLSGGNKYLPPRQDVNAPDLYIPIMGLLTYCILYGIVLFSNSSFRPDAIYSTFSSAAAGWIIHALLLKAMLWGVGFPAAAPVLELLAYAGYIFVMSCIVLLCGLMFGKIGQHVCWAYCSLCMAIFLIRTMKRILLQEAGTYSK